MKSFIHQMFLSQLRKRFHDVRDKYGCIAVEMESFALFANARYLHKKQLAF